MPQNRRRQLVVNRAVQTALIKAIAWPSLAALVVALGCVAVFVFHALEPLPATERRSQMITLVLAGALFVVVALGYVVYHAVHLSHHVAGPAFRIGSDLRRVRDGDASHRVRLRRGDFHGELAAEVNEFLDWVEGHARRAQSSGETRADASAVESTASVPTETGSRS